MRVIFKDHDLDRLEADPSYTAGFSEAVVKAFRKRMLVIRAAHDVRTLRNWKSLHFEKLRGSRQHQYSLRLNNQFRLVLELETGQSSITAIVVAIEDYH